MQGKYPDGLKLIEDDELRDFIQLCISHYPEARPDTRKLLKHSFFEECRGKCGDARERSFSELPPEHLAAAAAAPPPVPRPSSHDLPAAPVSAAVLNGTAAAHVPAAQASASTATVAAPPGGLGSVPSGSSSSSSTTSTSGISSPQDASYNGARYGAPTLSDVAQGVRDNTSRGGGAGGAGVPLSRSSLSDASTRSDAPAPPPRADAIFVKAATAEEEGVQVVAMEVGNLPQRDGDMCNIEFRFDPALDSVKQVMAEMQEELNLDLGEAETELIESKISVELRKCAARLLCAVYCLSFA